jgi:large subunit ribosomal protein L21
MEFAVIKTGGKQYRVSAGDTIRIEKMGNVTEVGQKVVFDEVLLVDNGNDTTIGMPFIDGAKVTGEVTKIGRAEKVMVVKYLQKSRYHKKNGHRQPFVEVKITAIK